MQIQSINIGLLTSKQISLDLLGEFISNKSNKTFSGNYLLSVENNLIHVSYGSSSFTAKEGLIFIPTNYETESFRLNNVKIGVDFHWEQQKKLEYKGSIKFLIEKDQITAVNIIDIEDYLVSVISSEMNPNNSLEFLKSHAIVSRSWLISQLINEKVQTQQYFIETENEIIKWYDKKDHKLFDVCADDHCQRYQGIVKLRNEKVEKAVRETNGLVLKYNDTVVDARYSKCCGGKTELFENVWEPIENKAISSIFDYKFDPDEFDRELKTEKCAERWIKENPNSFCNTNDKTILENILIDFDKNTYDFYRWTVEYSQDKIQNLISRNLNINFGNILDLMPIERGKSGRLVKLKIVGSNKTLTIGKELQIRKVLSETHLYSSAFYITKEDVQNGVPQKFILHGAGWGHGVGLCQIGAAVMAKLKYRFDEILLHYFPNVRISKVY